MLGPCVVGDFDGLEADGFPHPEVATAGRARVSVDLLVLVLHHVCLTNRTPPHAEILVALGVGWGYPDIHIVILLGIKATQAHQQSGEQAPGGVVRERRDGEGCVEKREREGGKGGRGVCMEGGKGRKRRKREGRGGEKEGGKGVGCGKED